MDGPASRRGGSRSLAIGGVRVIPPAAIAFGQGSEGGGPVRRAGQTSLPGARLPGGRGGSARLVPAASLVKWHRFETIFAGLVDGGPGRPGRRSAVVPPAEAEQGNRSRRSSPPGSKRPASDEPGAVRNAGRQKTRPKPLKHLGGGEEMAHPTEQNCEHLYD